MNSINSVVIEGKQTDSVYFPGDGRSKAAYRMQMESTRNGLVSQFSITAIGSLADEIHAEIVDGQTVRVVGYLENHALETVIVATHFETKPTPRSIK